MAASEPTNPPALLGQAILDAIRQAVREEIQAAIANGNGHGREPAELLKLKEAAKRLNQSESWLYRRWKELGGKKLGGNIRFSIADIEKFIAKRGA